MMPTGPADDAWSGPASHVLQSPLPAPSSNHDEGCPLNLTLRRRFCDRGMTLEAPSLRAKRTNPELGKRLGNVLLRGACHRARIRATRWLAMTGRRSLPLPVADPARL